MAGAELFPQEWGPLPCTPSPTSEGDPGRQRGCSERAEAEGSGALLQSWAEHGIKSIAPDFQGVGPRDP